MPDVLIATGKWWTMPIAYVAHPLIKNHFYYVIRSKLLDCIAWEHPGISQSSDWQMEMALARTAEANCSWVGFHDGNPITHYDLLKPRPSTLADLGDEDPKELGFDGWNQQKTRNAYEESCARFDWAGCASRGYCGWLLTNRQFLAEHDALLRRYQVPIQRYGFPLPIVSPGIPPFAKLDAKAKDVLGDCLRETTQLCLRWQLASVTAPYLPQPLQPQFPLLSASVTPSMASGGALSYMPKTCPLPSENDLRSLLQDATAQAHSASHLDKWTEVVSPANNNKREQLERYARIFEMQHFRRALFERHGQALHRKKGRLIQAFAWYYNLSSDSIKADSRRIEATTAQATSRLPANDAQTGGPLAARHG